MTVNIQVTFYRAFIVGLKPRNLHRHAVYEQAKQRHPECWTGKTRNWILPNAVTLNPDKKHKKLVELNDGIIEQAA